MNKRILAHLFVLPTDTSHQITTSVIINYYISLIF